MQRTSFAVYELVRRLTTTMAPIQYIAQMAKCPRLRETLALMRAMGRTVACAGGQAVVTVEIEHCATPHIIPVDVLFPAGKTGGPDGTQLIREARNVVETIGDNEMCDWVVLVVKSWLTANPKDRSNIVILMQIFAISDVNEHRMATVFLLAYQRLFSSDVVVSGYSGMWGILVHNMSMHAIGRMVRQTADHLSQYERDNWITAAHQLYDRAMDQATPLSGLLRTAAWDMGLASSTTLDPHHKLLVFIYLVTTYEGRQALGMWAAITNTPLTTLPTATQHILAKHAPPPQPCPAKQLQRI